MLFRDLEITKTAILNDTKPLLRDPVAGKTEGARRNLSESEGTQGTQGNKGNPN